MWRDFEATISGQTDDYLVFEIDGEIPTDSNAWDTEFPGVSGGKFKLAHSQRRASGVSVGGSPVSPHGVSPLALEGPSDKVTLIRGRICNDAFVPPLEETPTSTKIQVQIYGLTYADGTEAKTSLYPVELERI